MQNLPFGKIAYFMLILRSLSALEALLQTCFNARMDNWCKGRYLLFVFQTYIVCFIFRKSGWLVGVAAGGGGSPKVIFHLPTKLQCPIIGRIYDGILRFLS